MSQTSVAAGSNLALTQQSVGLTAQIIRAPGNLNAMTGPAPDINDLEKNLRTQTDAGMPFVRITDLSTDPKGDKVTVDAFNVTGGKPVMGDRNAEGLGKPLTNSSFSVLIDLATFNVDAGGKMSRQRTRHDLRRIARAEAKAYFPRFVWQRALVHCAGARGSQVGSSWDVPLSTDADFADIMVNTVLAPTNSRPMLHQPASEPVSGVARACASTVCATVRASGPTSSPICCSTSACAAWLDAVNHSISSSSGASESTA